MAMKTIYSAKCVRCGHNIHADSPIPDGHQQAHSASYFDHNALTAAKVCTGVFVNIMGRTREEIRAAAEVLRAQGE